MLDLDGGDGFAAVAAAGQRLAARGRGLFSLHPDPDAPSYWQEPARPTMTAADLAAGDVPDVAALVGRLTALWRERGDEEVLAPLGPVLAAAVVRAAEARRRQEGLVHTTYVMY